MKEPTAASPGFHQGLGLFDTTMLVAGSMIGAGIFIVPAAISREVGASGWLLVVWVLAGLLTVGGALCHAELAALMPRAGGQYVYLREAYGPLCGFLYGWMFLVIQTGTIAAVVQGLWASLLIFSGTYSDLLDYIIFAALLFYVLTVTGLVVLRRKRADAERPYRVWGYPFLPAAYVLGCLAIMLDLLLVKPRYTWPGFLIVLTGIPTSILCSICTRSFRRCAWPRRVRGTGSSSPAWSARSWRTWPIRETRATISPSSSSGGWPLGRDNNMPTRSFFAPREEIMATPIPKWALFLAAVAAASTPPLLAAEPAQDTKPTDLKSLPANQWVERPLNGWPGKFWFGPGIHFGFCQAGSRGLLVYDGAMLSKLAHIEDAKTVRIRKLDPATGTWTVEATDPIEPIAPQTVESLYGTQFCYDADRKTLVGISSTGLGGQGRTVEFDLEAKKVAAYKPKLSPPVVTAASLCYDPVNKEVVLATGGFSPIGGTDGTWLYDGAKKQWRKLTGPKEVDEARLPVEQVKDRLLTLRWLAWKNLEFRATGREKLLDERSQSATLAKEAAEIVGELQKLGDLGQKNAVKAERPYHQRQLASAAKLLGAVAGKLGGLDAKLQAGSPEEFEGLYGGSLVPALESVEQAVAKLAVTPEPRMSARLVYDSKNKVIVCFGGDGQRCTYGDTWVYHCEGRWWERRHPKTHPAPAAARAVAFDEKNGVTVCLESIVKGGYQVGWRTWCYDAARDEWTTLEATAPRDIFWLEYDPNAGCLVAFNHDMNKAWLMRLDRGATKPAETKPAPEVSWLSIEGAYVLRDAASLTELKQWQTAMDAWGKEVPANTWVPAPTHGTGRPNAGRTWSSNVYDPDRRQLYYRDGGHGSYHGADTDHYDLPTGRWFRSDRRDLPPWPMGSYFGWGRSFSLAPWAIHTYRYGLFYNPLEKRLQRRIGQSGVFENVSSESVVLEYDPDTGRWVRELRSVKDLFDRAGPAPQWFVPGAPDRLLRVSPWERYTPKKTTSVWQRTKDGERTWSDTGPLPYAANWDGGMCFVYDPPRHRVLFYGGAKDSPGLFALDVTAQDPKWQRLEIKAAEGQLPQPGREIVYVAKHDVFLMQARPAGATKAAVLEEMIWALDARSGTFRQVKLAKRPEVIIVADSGVSDGLQYDPVSDLCFFTQASGGTPQMAAFRYVPEKK